MIWGEQLAVSFWQLKEPCPDLDFFFPLIFVPLQHSFFKQFYASVTKSDYVTLRLGFIMVKYFMQGQICLTIISLHLPMLHFITCFSVYLLVVLQTHTRGNPKFNFHRYMVRSLEDDFKTVVGIRQVMSKNTFLRLDIHIACFAYS